MVRWWCIGAGLCCLMLGSSAHAQAADTSAKQSAPADPRDTLFLRARAMVLNGNGTAGRALVDSVLAGAEGTPEYGNALYWRAALAAMAADAERDYRRVIVEYPFSAHSGDALLALAQLEMARGDRSAAVDHLQRYLAQQPPNDPQRVRVGISLGRLLLETNQVAKGCAALLRTRAALGDTAVEIRNQVDYYAARCDGVDTSAAAAVPRATTPAARSATSATPTASSSASRPAAPVSRPSPTPVTPPRDSGAKPNGAAAVERRFTVQVAAYDTKSSAQQLVARLGERGIVARVAGTSAPFRVRIGHYETEAAAMAAVRQLKSKGIEGFVTTSENERAAPERR
jgi:SPOR domain